MSRVRPAGFAFAWAAAMAGACGGGATNDPALGSKLRVAGGQFVRGAMPAVASGAPIVASIDLATNTIWPGEAAKVLGGSLGQSATAAALALDDDEGYWIVPAGVPDFAAPALPTFHAAASFATTMQPGLHALQVRAIEASGAFGAPSTRTLTALDAAPSAISPDSNRIDALIVSLSWDTEADLDLHVVDPAGHEIYHGSPQALSEDGGVAGRLAFDSNAQCLLDGRREEDVIWPTAEPAGAYRVLVDTPSLCGQPIAHWEVRVALRGVSIEGASGVALDSDTWGPHDRGAGLLALRFDVP